MSMKKIFFIVISLCVLTFSLSTPVFAVLREDENGETYEDGVNPPAFDPLSQFDEAGGRPDPSIDSSKYYGDKTASPTSSSSCGNKLKGLQDLVCQIQWLLNQAIYFIFALAFVSFLYGVFKYMQKGNSADGQKEGAHFIWYGIVSLAVMFSVWGLVNFVLNTFDLEASPVPKNIKNLIQ